MFNFQREKFSDKTLYNEDDISYLGTIYRSFVYSIECIEDSLAPGPSFVSFSLNLLRIKVWICIFFKDIHIIWFETFHLQI